jgi:hypothetical protein
MAMGGDESLGPRQNGELHAEANAGQRRRDDHFEREVGRLLGYPDAAIEAFIARFGKGDEAEAA